jgi:hypothetical protein
MGQIESEMQKIYAAASNVGRGGALKTSKPTAIAGSMVAVIHALEATDVVAKSVRKKMTSRSWKSDPGQTLSGNAAKVFEHLVSILDPSAFTKINQSAVAVAVGLPNGSIGAAMVKLLKSGYLAKGPNGDFKIQAVQ